MINTHLNPRSLLLIAATTCLAALTGCGVFRPDAVATWRVADGQTLTDETTVFTADVTRLGCNSGDTGTVRDPQIDESDDAVVITFKVNPEDFGAANCVGNERVAHSVQLSSPLGGRALVDGACEGTEAADTSSCSPDGVRRPAT